MRRMPRGVTPTETSRIKDLRAPTSKLGKTESDGVGVRDRTLRLIRLRCTEFESDPVVAGNPL
jgi:hypothetical protein